MEKPIIFASNSGCQSDINCGASFQADFILNYYLSNFFSNSPFPPSPADRPEQIMSPGWLFIYISPNYREGERGKGGQQLVITDKEGRFWLGMSTICALAAIFSYISSKHLKGQLWPRVSDEKSSLSHAVSWRSVVTPRKWRKIITFTCCVMNVSCDPA